MPDPYDIASIDMPEDSGIHALLEACPDIEPVRFANDEFIVHGSDDTRDIFLLLRGNCLVEQPDAPQERTPGNELAIISAEPGNPVFVGEMAYLGGGFRSAAVRSVMACFTLRLKPAHLDTIMERFPWFTRVLCKQFALRLGEANAFIKRFQQDTAMDVDQRFMNPGDVLVEAGTPAHAMYQLVDGALIIKDDEDTVLRPDEGKPRFIGAHAFFTGAPHPHQIVAKTSAIVISLGESRKAAIIRNFPDLALETFEQALHHREPEA